MSIIIATICCVAAFLLGLKWGKTRPSQQTDDSIFADRAECAFEEIEFALWPNGRTDEQWSADTLDVIAETMQDMGYGPDPLREPAKTPA